MKNKFLQTSRRKNADSKQLQFLQDSTRTHYISDLFPYRLEEKRHSKLSDGLKEYKLLLVAAKQALTHFQKGSFSSFDSLVGENSCQIRATMIHLLAKKSKIESTDLLENILYIIEKLNLMGTDLREEFYQKTSLATFLKSNHFNIKISFREIFLISSYILAKVRVLLPPNPLKRIVRNENTDTKKVKEISAVGSTFARDLVKKLRNLVSTASVSFVQDIANLLPFPDSVLDMVSDKYCINHNKFGRLKCLPSFWYTVILMQYSLAIELPLVLIINQIASDRDYKIINKIPFYFKVIDGSYQSVSSSQFPKDIPALIVLGSCCRKFDEFPEFDVWKKEFLSYDPHDLFLAYAAAHRQYPDKSKDILIKEANCPAFNFYRSKAAEWGCSLDNPSLFFLVHAYCDTIGNT